MARKLKVETLYEASENNDPDACWLWPHYVDPDGYGKVRVGGEIVSAHRFSYEYNVGPIRAGMLIDHACGTRSCFNPNHLRPVSKKGNAEHRTKLDANNTSGFRGVSFYRSSGKYVARVRHNGKILHLGYFATAEEAGAVSLAKRTELGFMTGMNDTPNPTPDLQMRTSC